MIVYIGACGVAVQAKCYSGSVGNDAMQQALAGMMHYGWPLMAEALAYDVYRRDDSPAPLTEFAGV